MKQHTKIKMEITVEFDAKHSQNKLMSMARSAVRCLFPNNRKYFDSVNVNGEEMEFYIQDDLGEYCPGPGDYHGQEKHEITVDRETFDFLIVHADDSAKVIKVCKEILNEE